jgi:hypothetical protein
MFGRNEQIILIGDPLILPIKGGGINWQIFGNKTPNCDRNPVDLTPQKIKA